MEGQSPGCVIRSQTATLSALAFLCLGCLPQHANRIPTELAVWRAQVSAGVVKRRYGCATAMIVADLSYANIMTVRQGPAASSVSLSTCAVRSEFFIEKIRAE